MLWSLVFSVNSDIGAIVYNDYYRVISYRRSQMITTILEISGYTNSVIPVRGRKERNVLFNDALNTFYLRWRQIYGKGPLR